MVTASGSRGSGQAGAIVINGAPGVGKTTALQALGALLRAHDRPHGLIDLDHLALSWPSPPHDRYRLELATRNLAHVAAAYRDAGARHLVVAHVFTSADARDMTRRALGEPTAPLIRLRADSRVVAQRLRRRHDIDAPWELADFLAGHADVEHALDVADLDDVVIDVDDLTPSETAARIAANAGWVDG